jgi:CRISPR-associated protein Cas2
MYLTYLKSAVSYACCLFGDLVIYDLPDSEGAPKRRTRLHKLLSGYRKWTQYSVFECFLTAVQFVKLQQQVEKLIKPVEDSVRIYVLDADSLKRTITYGSQQPREERAIVF